MHSAAARAGLTRSRVFWLRVDDPAFDFATAQAWTWAAGAGLRATPASR
ncbi:hypothetical protein [Kitasatospora cineracea]|uniref:Uncharacterized protein n=1 Tax=Kitasatospora cineracea TaxID=88074 RepID=A0A3N4S983_9ACTN|nr:hypothetical protein [Kitasatospora cineracea]RPE37087.1 hypothetical protein EDD38_5474 [Kitasatospora cineracea]